MPRIPKFKPECPHGSFSSSVNQGIANTSLAYPITYNNNDEIYRLSHNAATSDSKVYILEHGSYLITFSAIGKSSSPNKTLDIWIAVDGTPVSNSNTISNFVGSANERVITVTYILNLMAGQYIELYMHSDDIGTIIEATAAQITPTRPACPSIILTVNKVSEYN